MPSRIIRDSCRTSPNLDALSDAAERMFWRLTTVADDFGRFESDPRVLLSSCFPLRCDRIKTNTVKRWLEEMVTCELVTTYVVNGRHYAFFNTWEKHQRVRAKESKYPLPTSDNICGHPPRNAPVFGGKESRVRGMGDGGHEVGRSAGADSLHTNGPIVCPPEWEFVKARLDTLTWLKRPELYDWEWWKRLDEAYADFQELDVCAELSKAEAHLMAKPRKAKVMKDFRLFLLNWFRIAARDVVKHAKG